MTDHNFKPFTEYLLKQYKGTSYINAVKQSIKKSSNMNNLKDNLLESGMFLGSFQILLRDFRKNNG